MCLLEINFLYLMYYVRMDQFVVGKDIVGGLEGFICW